MARQSSLKNANDWNRVAQRYVEISDLKRNRSHIQLSKILWETIGDVDGLEVLDLGCGHGWLSGKLRDMGAKVTGIDYSMTILAYASKRYQDVVFIHYDLANGLPDLKRCYDRVIANMVLMNIKDINNLVSSVRTCLKPTGKFIFSITHPCFFNYEVADDPRSGKKFRKVIDYLKESTWRIDSFGGHYHYHRSLTYYFELLRENKFAVTRFFEPKNVPKSLNSKYHTPNIPVFALFESIPIYD